MVNTDHLLGVKRRETHENAAVAAARRSQEAHLPHELQVFAVEGQLLMPGQLRACLRAVLDPT